MPRAYNDNNIDEIDFNKPLSKAQQEILATHLAIDQETIIKNGVTGYLVRGLVNASMPYKNPNTPIFERKNGDTTLRMLAGSSCGLPFGRYPRFLMAWLTTEVVRTKSQELFLGNTLRDFLLDVVGVRDTGGAEGTRTRLLEQAARLFGSTITVERLISTDSTNGKRRGIRIRNISVSDSADIDFEDEKRLWTPWHEPGVNTFQSRVVVSNRFFSECIEAPVPLNFTAYRLLSSSVMAMDIYAWLTYRMSYLVRESSAIPWLALMNQFGSIYNGADAGRNFKRDFLKALKLVATVYPNARFRAEDNGLVLMPSSTHVPKVERKTPRQGELGIS
jgi:hypothetical protein